MHGLILICLTSLALAAPQGYNYAATAHQPHQQYGPMPVSTANFLKDLQAVMAVQSGNIESNYVAQPQLLAYPSSNSLEQYTAPSAAAEAVVQPSTGARYLAPIVAATANMPTANAANERPAEAETIISKRFFIHSAPEEAAEEVQYKMLTVGKPRKNYNVVFIKAPAKSAQKTKLTITPAVSEDKTVVYVLAKKQDEHEIDAQVHEPATTTTKPEVFFIKYKTAEEAAHAQQTIQAQYDSLGGSTQVLNEGIAPESSVIGALDALNQAADAAQAEQEAQYIATASGGSAQQQQQQQQQQQLQQPAQELVSVVQSTSNGYLPPSKYYH